MSPFGRAPSSALLTTFVLVCGCDPPRPLEARLPEPRPIASVQPARPEPPPPVLPAQSKRSHIVSIGRVTERFVTTDACEIDDDCVVVSRHREVELCPPGTVTNRRGHEIDERWGARGFAFRPPRAVCIDQGTTLRPSCVEHRCVGDAVPAGEADTQSEKRIWAVHDQLEACQREATLRNEPGTAEALFTAVLSRDGSVANVSTQGALPDALKRCLYRVLIRLQFEPPAETLQLRVPLELQAVAEQKLP